MTTLKVAIQPGTGRRVVEVFGNDGVYVATIVPANEHNGIRIGSYCLDGVEPDKTLAPGLIVKFKRTGR